MISAGEGLGLVNVVEDICRKTKHLLLGEVVVYNDNKLLLKGINNKVRKNSQYMLEAGVIIAKLKQLKNKASIDIAFEYSSNKMNPELAFK